MHHFLEISDVKSRYRDFILGKPNVVGVGIGQKARGGKRAEQLCITVLVRQKLPIAALPEFGAVPGELEGVMTDVVAAGDLRAHNGRSARWRPIPAGVSLAHYQVTAGTFGCIVRDQETNQRMVLSNNHVLANGNQARQGDPILQPGSADGGGTENDTVASLKRFIPIAYRVEPPTCGLATGLAKTANLLARTVRSTHRLQATKEDEGATNQVDAAVAEPLQEVEFLDEILDIGRLEGTTPAMLGSKVRKSGRTTGYSRGEIIVLDATVDIFYGERQARFEGQIVSTAMSAPGDSGAVLVMEDSLLAIGLLFAGSEKVTLYNPIEIVLEQLQVTL